MIKLCDFMVSKKAKSVKELKELSAYEPKLYKSQEMLINSKGPLPPTPKRPPKRKN